MLKRFSYRKVPGPASSLCPHWGNNCRLPLRPSPQYGAASSPQGFRSQGSPTCWACKEDRERREGKGGGGRGYLHIVLALLQQEPQALVQHCPGEILCSHLSPRGDAGTPPSLVDNAGLESSVGTAELLLGGGSHPLHHLHQSAVVITAVVRDGRLLLDTLGMLQVV